MSPAGDSTPVGQQRQRCPAPAVAEHHYVAVQLACQQYVPPKALQLHHTQGPGHVRFTVHTYGCKAKAVHYIKYIKHLERSI
jgi:hypothetical protein